MLSMTLDNDVILNEVKVLIRSKFTLTLTGRGAIKYSLLKRRIIYDD
jgi:hypothetical protein